MPTLPQSPTPVNSSPAHFIVKQTAEGTWLVYEPGEPAIEGTAVYLYANGCWRCQEHGDWWPRGTPGYRRAPHCVHIARVQLSLLPTFQGARLLGESLFASFNGLPLEVKA